jgi:hypothetical protein
MREIAPLIPFAEDIITLQEDRQELRFIPADRAALALPPIADKVRQARAATDAAVKDGKPPTPLAITRAAQSVDGLRGVLDQWFGFYNGYDPGFTTKVAEPHKALSTALTDTGGFCATSPPCVQPERVRTTSSAIRSAATGCSRISPAR